MASIARTTAARPGRAPATDNVRPFYYSQVRVHPTNPDRVWFSSTPVKVSNDGGKTRRTRPSGSTSTTTRCGSTRTTRNAIIVGDDGGVAISFDNGGNYVFLNNFVVAQPYNVSFDMAVPYRVCAGLQDNGSWCGPSRRKQGAITNAMWFNDGGGDGFVTQQDPTDPDIVYSESQGGNIGRYVVSDGRTHRAAEAELS